MIPWLTRLPTAAEVCAHAAAHPAEGYAGYGYWLRYDGEPRLMLLSSGLFLDDDGVWLPNGDMLTERRMPGAKWLPCTGAGVPVDYHERVYREGWEQHERGAKHGRAST